MKVPSKEALKGIISAMKELQVKQLKGYKKKGDEDPAFEVLEMKKKKDLENELEE